MEETVKKVYFTRDSFCAGDDTAAPNIMQYEWYDSDWEPECEIFAMIDDYIYPELPGFFWRGYAGGKKIADINMVRESTSYRKECVIVDNWQELLREYGCIHFLHTEYEDRNTLPEYLGDRFYSYEEAEQIYESMH